jgi:hypothetical protein
MQDRRVCGDEVVNGELWGNGFHYQYFEVLEIGFHLHTSQICDTED